MNIREKILVIEDEKSIARFISTILTANGYEAMRAASGAEAMSMISSHCPDLVILDLGLPDRDGLEFIRTVRQKYMTPIVVLSARTDEMDKIEALDLGANDYITKPFSMLLLGKRVTALLRRCGKKPELKQMQFGEVLVDFSGYTASDADGRIDITPKEIDLLKLLVEHKGMVLSRTQILDELWGYDTPIIDRTIDTYIKNLRKKLRLDCIITVKGVGYKYEK